MVSRTEGVFDLIELERPPAILVQAVEEHVDLQIIGLDTELTHLPQDGRANGGHIVTGGSRMGIACKQSANAAQSDRAKESGQPKWKRGAHEVCVRARGNVH